MTNQEIRQLAVWLKEADLAGAQICRPGMQLLLKRCSEAGGVAAAPPVEAAHEQLLKTPGLGHLRLTHPDHREVLVTVGSLVGRGQLVAFLQVGELLLPVRSQHAGRLAAVLTECGAAVGYGEAFMRLAAE
ncbi:biotin/lipoyl-containing protein [Pseudomonas sp.]|jgi:biotin carboxyl carrier protein|uniref:biotin/lipoyl-containing protein n=1 Tax=Pseudomonas sp. TaxID=306 RepID=UPI003FD7BB85